MHAMYDKDQEGIVIGFTGSEREDAAIRMKLVSEEMKRDGLPVPKFSKGFLDEIASFQSDIQIVFGLESSAFVGALIKETLEKTADESTDVKKLRLFLYEIDIGKYTLH